MHTFSTLINIFTLAAFIFLTAAVVYEGAIAIAQTIEFATAPISFAVTFIPAPTLPPTPEMPLEMPIVSVPDIPDAELLETRPSPVLTPSEAVSPRSEVEAIEDSPEDASDASELPNFHEMSVRQLRDYCKINGIRGYSKYAQSGKEHLANWLEVRALGEIGRADTENLRDRYPEGSQTWNAQNDIAQTL